MLVIIGKDWLGEKKKFIIPVLVNNATLPKKEDLPTTLKFLTNLNACSIREDPDFHKDMNLLIENIVNTKIS